MSHYIIECGAFAAAFDKLQAGEFKLRWQSQAQEADPGRAKKKASKTKYTCPECGANAWAKPGASLICGECWEDGDGNILAMEPEL